MMPYATLDARKGVLQVNWCYAYQGMYNQVEQHRLSAMASAARNTNALVT